MGWEVETCPSFYGYNPDVVFFPPAHRSVATSSCKGKWICLEDSVLKERIVILEWLAVSAIVVSWAKN